MEIPGISNFLVYPYLIGLLAVLGGCVALQPLPTAARAGDTIALAVGSADGMMATNTTVEFYSGPDPNVVAPIAVPIRSVVKVNPDKTSVAWLTADAHKIPKRSSHGGWLSVIVVDLPSTLPEGVGVIRITTDGQVVYPRFAATANGTDIQMTILPGTGSVNPFDYAVVQGSAVSGDLLKLESLPQVIVKPPVPPEGQEEIIAYGAVEISITAPIVSLDSSPIVDKGVAVVLDDQPQNIDNQTSLLWKRRGDDFDIMLISPKGLYSYQTRFSIVPRFPDYLYKIEGTPLLNSITYYDLDGMVITGPTPMIFTIDPTF